MHSKLAVDRDVRAPVNARSGGAGSRGALRSLLLDSLGAVRGEGLIADHSDFDGATWRYHSPHASFEFGIPADGRLYVVGAGKATASLARGMERVFGDHIAGGCIVVKYDHTEDLQQIRQIEAGHPIPDRNGLEGTQQLLATLDGLTPRDRVVVLLSGGASSLLVAPVPGISFEEKSLTSKVLIESGAGIQEINAVRKALSRIKGGGLLDRIEPASSITLLISDVPDSDAGTVGSGPTIRDDFDPDLLSKICERYHLKEKLPQSVVTQLMRDPQRRPSRASGGADHRVVTLAESADLVRALIRAGEASGLNCTVVNAGMSGQTHQEAKAFVEAIEQAQGMPGPHLLIAAGETTLEVTGAGKGGRNQEFALYAGRLLERLEGVCLLAAGTDGTDGPTDATGAFVDPDSWRRMRQAGCDPERALRENDAYPAFEAIGDLFITGPTGTNVMDVVLALVPGSSDTNPAG